MDELDWLAKRFEEHRAHMRAVAYRMLGSSAPTPSWGAPGPHDLRSSTGRMGSWRTAARSVRLRGHGR